MSMRESHPYWEYVHSDAVEEPREEHLAWNGMVLRWDDPWWVTHFPINAWGCQCGVIARTDDDLKRMGKTGPDTAPTIKFVQRTIGQRSPGGPRTVFVPEGIDPGFEHTPGRSKYFSQVPPPRGGSPVAPTTPDKPPPTPPPLPLPRPAREPVSENNGADAFLSAFGATATRPVAFHDAAGQRIAIGADMFAARDGAGQVNDAADQLLLLAQAIQATDEIWAQVVWQPANQQAVVHRRYLARFEVAGQPDPVSVIFEIGTDGWAGNVSTDDTLLQSMRQGVMLYQRGDE